MNQDKDEESGKRRSHKKWNRRTILTAAGGSLVTTGLASSAETDSNIDLRYDDNKTFKNDISIINNASQNHSINIMVLSENDSQAMLEREFNIDGLHSSPDVAENEIHHLITLDINGDNQKHAIVAEYGDSRDSTKLTLTSEGPATYQRVDVNIGVEGDVSTTLVSK